MIDFTKIEEQLSQLPLYIYSWIDPKELEFSGRIRWICEHECPMYGKSWACPPGVGTVEGCKKKCTGFSRCLMISTITEVSDIANIDETLATRPEHEHSNNCFDLQENLYRFNPTVYHLNFEEMMQSGREFIELKPEEPKVFYIWGHSYEMDYGADYWVKLENFFKLISNKEDIFYGTNKEVLL